MSVACIIVAAGKGERFGGDKMSALLGDKTVLENTVERIQRQKDVDVIIVVANPESIKSVQKICTSYGKVQAVVPGGNSRAESVKNGFDALACSDGDSVLIHNGSNPLVTDEEIQDAIHALSQYSVVSVGHIVTDTVKRVNMSEEVAETLDRSELRLMQTPQGFRYGVLKKLYKQFGVEDVTDELQLAERAGEKIKIVPASACNFKITTPEDLRRAHGVLFGSEVLTGIGEDSHKFSDNGKLILGGMEISDCPRLDGNSDADVIYHALFNAISSALGKGSISTVADAMCRNGITDSSEYLKVLLTDLSARHMAVRQVSVSLECARPKIEPIADVMKTNISKLLGVPKERIGITATTGEDLTSFGRGEGIRCTCVVFLVGT